MAHFSAMTDTLSIAIHNPEHMSDLARAIARDLAPGDCILLDGIIGAGKSYFARSLILSLLRVPEDIPSPTFTLVQTYDGPDCEIWHSDLYRLSALNEIFELGLVDAFESEITLVEWPEKLQDLSPPHALHLRIELSDRAHDARLVTFEWSDPKWTPRMKKLSND